MPKTVEGTVAGSAWAQIAAEPRGIWRGAPCLPANWVLMNHWFGVLHVPRDGLVSLMHWWCPVPREGKRAVTAERGRRADAEHFTETGQSTKITSYPAPRNGNNCLMAWQFNGPFDCSNAPYSDGVAASSSTHRVRTLTENHCPDCCSSEFIYLYYI